MSVKKKLQKLLLFASFILTAALTAGCGKGSEESTAQSEAALSVSIIDVGKGDCILAACGGKNILIDAGYEDTADEVEEYLTSHNCSGLEAMVITHYDKDHVGGAAKLAEDLDIAKIYLPDYEGKSTYYNNLMKVIEDKGISASKVSEDVTLSLGSATFTLIASDVEYSDPDGEEGNDNDVSLVISATFGEDSILFAGDIEKDGIKAFLKKHTESYEILKMPHHGKTEKNSDDLLKSVNPDCVIITDSTKDPAEDDLLELLEDKKVYRTSECGTISISITGSGYTVSTASN